MPIDKIFEIKERTKSSLVFHHYKVNLSVHCSCGEDYKIKEGFPSQLYISHTRTTECPSCKEETKLKHNITKDKTTGESSYSVEIITKR